MAEITLHADTGRPTGSRASGRLRAEGKVPGTVYGLAKDPASVSVVWRDLRHVLTGEAGLNALIDLEISGSTELVIVKEMQRHPVRRDVLHVDFLRVSRDQAITVEVPVVLRGEATEVLSHDGQVDQALYNLAISAKPADIPNEIGIDISGLTIGAAIRVGDVELPPGVTTEADPEDAIVSASVSQEADLGEVPEVEEPEEGVEGEEGIEAPSAEGDDSSGE